MVLSTSEHHSTGSLTGLTTRSNLLEGFTNVSHSLTEITVKPAGLSRLLSLIFQPGWPNPYQLGYLCIIHNTVHIPEEENKFKWAETWRGRLEKKIGTCRCAFTLF